tara:strand:+ start:584 stop:2095 length:1512 start_codon:yes stop_codon:yes gene_type:complete
MSGNMIPSVLIQNSVVNENQDSVLNTVRLTPNSFSNNTVVFVVPKSGSVLDHNSSLVWTVSWENFDFSKITDNQRVALKQLSGGLPTLQRSRLYVGGRLLFTNQDIGQTVHIDKLATNPDHLVEVEDVKVGAQRSYVFQENGKIEAGLDSDSARLTDNRLCRALGSFSETGTANRGYECTLLLHDMFPALKGGIQLPVKYLKEEIRIEIDFETDFDEVAQCIKQTDNLAGRTIQIKNPLLFLDFLSYDPMVEAGLMESVMNGIAIPYREISYIQKQIPANTANNVSSDILLGFQGKLLMKIYVSHRNANTLQGATNGDGAAGGVTVTGPQILQGRCRSERGKNMEYNLIVNDIFIHDQNVDTASQQYNFLSMTKQNPIYTYPNSFDYNKVFAAAIAPGDFNSGLFEIGGTQRDVASIAASAVRNGLAGSQAFIGFDLSKYGPDGGINPSNSGFRVGSTPIILRIQEDGGAITTIEGTPKQVDVFCESVKILQIRGGLVDTVDA